MGGPQIAEAPAEKYSGGRYRSSRRYRFAPTGRIVGEVVDLEPCPARLWGRRGRQLIAVVVFGVGVVARRVGYDAEEAFSRAFKRAHGESPSVWRAGYMLR